jgi:hypothetical protein
MNLVVALSELGKARRFVRDGRKCMIRQRRIVEHLERRGHDAFEAIQFLVSKKCNRDISLIATGSNSTYWFS